MEKRVAMAQSSPTSRLICSRTSSQKRARFSSEPPYLSLRRLKWRDSVCTGKQPWVAVHVDDVEAGVAAAPRGRQVHVLNALQVFYVGLVGVGLRHPRRGKLVHRLRRVAQPEVVNDPGAITQLDAGQRIPFVHLVGH